MGTIIEATARRSNLQNNITSNMNTEGEYFLHFEIIEANLLGVFETFENNNNNPSSGNNNNNNPPSPLPLPLPGFGGGLGGDFNSPSGGNVGRLDPNIAALVNALAGANLKTNHIEKESNHVKLTEFEGTEAEDPNK